MNEIKFPRSRSDLNLFLPIAPASSQKLIVIFIPV